MANSTPGVPGRKSASGPRGKVQRRSVPAGLEARLVAVSLIDAVLSRGRAFDDVLAKALSGEAGSKLEPRDRALAHLIAATVLRRLGELEAVLAKFMTKPLPERNSNVRAILLAGAAQLLALETPPHAAISLAVEQCRRDVRSRHFDRLVNAVLRRVAEEGSAVLAGLDAARANIPDWLWRRWQRTFGEETARRIAEASLTEALLDLSVKSDPADWAARLGGVVLPTGTVRLTSGGRVEQLAGYAEGAWWVQDAAAALPARLFGEVKGLAIADLCAAPGGKTAELAAAGANVTAVEVSADRLNRLQENLARLRLEAELVVADAATWAPQRTFDGVLLDAPCSATGTIRRHPDVLRLKHEVDLIALADVQARLLDNAAHLVRPGGLLVYCTCSLEPEEGPEQVRRFLARTPGFARIPVLPPEIGGEASWITPEGDLRTLPSQVPGHTPVRGAYPGGVDGFYAARLTRLR